MTISATTDTIDVLDAIASRATKERSYHTSSANTVGKLPLPIYHSTNAWLKDLAYDPWPNSIVQTESIDSSRAATTHTRVLIVGAGYGGLLFSVRLLQAGFSLEDLILVDSAGGFGGTWYWNRYPGLMCDIESYIYMPLLEETGHAPSRKYVPGEELRGHAETIAAKWQLQERTLFHTTVKSLEWDEDEGQWIAQAVRSSTGEKEGNSTLTITATLAILATGTLSKPKVPDLPGMDNFQGHIFHTARWDYDYTGGSPIEPAMHRLQGKRVGVIGTGSTAVQVIPQLASWSNELLVFQRTPAAVGLQKNQVTDRVWWKDSIQKAGSGWQRKRSENFNAFISNSNEKDLENLINDGWTISPSFSAAIGGTLNMHPDFLELAKGLDRPRQEAAQHHIRSTVRDPRTAEALINLNYGWCKRPCFHQGYLETYNLPHVRLIKTDSQGVTGLTTKGILVGGTEYELDLVVLATGYDVGSLCPAERAQVMITGSGAESMAQKWARGPTTLHGVMTRGFPNLFFPGTSQAGVTANQSYMFDRAAEHVAYIIKNSCLRTGYFLDQVRIEPTQEAEEQWTMQVVARAGAFAATKVCGAGGYTIENRCESTDMDKMARHMPWGEGMASYVRILEDWRSSGRMEGLKIAHSNASGAVN
ncbi:hypothetical protein BDW59DRAFT_161063 [Aspergillus cavernicola]|uniref:FAD/NAD(P)-binding domain-containing protein n=1 Tax=Aspergillus cavernicola TaxID=176166 RepID=A0ABR4IER4_9EURO